MKKLIPLFAAMFMTTVCFAQLPDESIAPDFQLYEINKTTGQMETDHTIHLYEWLDDYKTVFIDVSASTCGPCQSFHQTGTLSSLVTQYGESGTNDTRVLFIEGASTGSSWAAISGQTSGTWNVTAGANYPIVPLRISPNYPGNYNSFHSNYAISYFPTMYMVCPNRMIYNLSRDGSNQAAAWHSLAQSTCPNTSNQNAAMLIGSSLDLDQAYFCSYDITPQISFQNLGSETMNSAVITLTHGSDTYTQNWTGNLDQYGIASITFPELSGNENGEHILIISIDSINGVANQEQVRNNFSTTFNVVAEATASTIEEDFAETALPSGWTLVDNCDGYYGFYQGAFYFYAYYIQSGGSLELFLPMLDFTGMNTPWMQFSVAYRQYNTSSNDKLQVRVSSNCGQNWTTVYSKSGNNLKTGSPQTSAYTATASQYRTDPVDLTAFANQPNVLVKFVCTSGYGNNIWLDNIKLVNEDLSAIESIENQEELSIYPVPAQDVLNIEYNKGIKKVEVYDMEGRLVKSYGHVENTISVNGLATGSYILNITTDDGIIVKNFVKE